VRLASDSMTGAGLFPGDIAVIDRSVTPVAGCIVLALLDGEFTIKRYRPREGGVVLQADNPAFPDIEVTPERAFEVWGVVTKSIRMLSP
jgi:DNA polymerase V